eukprot:363196-Chlamydomonas_euryale.AAC.2
MRGMRPCMSAPPASPACVARVIHPVQRTHTCTHGGRPRRAHSTAAAAFQDLFRGIIRWGCVCGGGEQKLPGEGKGDMPGACRGPAREGQHGGHGASTCAGSGLPACQLPACQLPACQLPACSRPVVHAPLHANASEAMCGRVLCSGLEPAVEDDGLEPELMEWLQAQGVTTQPVRTSVTTFHVSDLTQPAVPAHYFICGGCEHLPHGQPPHTL